MRLFIEESGDFINMTEGVDLSLAIGKKGEQVGAWYLDDPVISPVEAGDFIGSVEQGAPVNFNNIFFNPHAHGTHTESLGHITRAFHSVNSIVHPLFYEAELISIRPEKQSNGDEIITLRQLQNLGLERKKIDALLIRTLPNLEIKREKKYSYSNPAFLHVDCAKYLLQLGVQHLLVDLPSVDKEQDQGELAFHHAFWEVPDNPNFKRTITEFIFVPDACEDGSYLLNLQMAPFENDASPSRPVIYKKHKA